MERIWIVDFVLSMMILWTASMLPLGESTVSVASSGHGCVRILGTGMALHWTVTQLSLFFLSMHI
jgi:hypothetical protein